MQAQSTVKKKIETRRTSHLLDKQLEVTSRYEQGGRWGKGWVVDTNAVGPSTGHWPGVLLELRM